MRRLPGHAAPGACGTPRLKSSAPALPPLLPGADLSASVPHCTLAQVSLRSLWSAPGTKTLQAFGGGLAPFVNLGADKAMVCGLTDPENMPIDGWNGAADVSVFTPSGRVKVASDGFIEFLRAAVPDVVLSMADVQTAATRPKRQNKSVDRTLVYLDELLGSAVAKDGHCAVFGAVVGGADEGVRRRSAVETAKRDVDGFAIEGLATGESPEQLAALVGTVLGAVPSSKPRWLQCACGPEEVLAMVDAGIDLFDGLYPITVRHICPAR